MSERDRKNICNIMSDMLDNPDEHGIYPTSTAYTRLEHLIESERIMAMGWAVAECCVTLDKGDDPRFSNVPDLVKRAMDDLE